MSADVNWPIGTTKPFSNPVPFLSPATHRRNNLFHQNGMKLCEGDFPHLQILLKDLRFRFLQQISILSAGNITKLMISISVNSKINVISSRGVYPTVLTKPLGENDDNR